MVTYAKISPKSGEPERYSWGMQKKRKKKELIYTRHLFLFSQCTLFTLNFCSLKATLWYRGINTKENNMLLILLTRRANAQTISQTIYIFHNASLPSFTFQNQHKVCCCFMPLWPFMKVNVIKNGRKLSCLMTAITIWNISAHKNPSIS